MSRAVALAASSAVVAAGLGLALHLLVGWPWVLAAALVAGLVAPQRAGALGAAVLAALGVAASWGGLLVWNHARYDAPVDRMTEAMGTVLGGWSPAAVPLLSLGVGVVLGLLGGAIGSLLRAAVWPSPASDTAPGSVPSPPRVAPPASPPASSDPLA